jgi:hypothetical protein
MTSLMVKVAVGVWVVVVPGHPLQCVGKVTQ